MIAPHHYVLSSVEARWFPMTYPIPLAGIRNEQDHGGSQMVSKVYNIAIVALKAVYAHWMLYGD